MQQGSKDYILFYGVSGKFFQQKRTSVRKPERQVGDIYLGIYRSSRSFQMHPKQPEETHSFSIEYFHLKGEKNEA